MNYKIIFAASFFALILGLIFFGRYVKKRKRFVKKVFISSVIVFATFIYGILSYFFTEYAVRFAGAENVTVKAEVRAVTEYVFCNESEIIITEINGKTAPLSLYALLSDYEKSVLTGDIILFSADIKSLLETDDVSAYEYYRSKNIYLRCEPVLVVADEENYDEKIAPIVILQQGDGKTDIFSRFREYSRKLFFSQIISRDTPKNWANTYMKTDAGALVYSMFTGYKNYITPEMKASFAATGISHILTVSGLNLSVLTGVLLLFMQKIRVNKKICYIILILFCLFYMIFTGFSISIVRAGIMHILFYAAFLSGRSGDALTSLFFAGSVICLISPPSIFNFGFRLSFFATLGMILTAPASEKILKKLRGKNLFFKAAEFVFSSFFAAAAAIIFTSPFTSYATKTLSLSAPLVNIIVSAPLNLILLILPVYILLSFVPFFSVAIIGKILYFLADFVIKISEFFAGLKYTQISVSTCVINIFFIFAALSVLLILFYFIAAPYKNRFVKALPILIAVSFLLQILAVLLPKIYMYEYLQISFYTVKTNQYIMIFSEDSQKADLIDIGGGYSSVAGDLAELIKKHGAVEINKLIFTHYHANQPKEIEKLLNYMKITSVYFPVPETEYDKDILHEVIYQGGNGSSKLRQYEIITYGDEISLSEKYALSFYARNYWYQKRYVLTGEIRFEDRNYAYMNSGFYDEELYGYSANGGYDFVFTGNHQHKLKDFYLGGDIKGNYASVITSYNYYGLLDEDTDSFIIEDKNYFTFMISKNNKDNIKFIQRFIYG